jgi:uncharacterized repeat protein (TIGR01451 family)
MRKSIYIFVTLFMLAVSGIRSHAQSIESYFIAQSYDVCGTYFCPVTTSGFTSGQSVRFYWGDGANDLLSLSSWSAPDTGNTTGWHPYSTPGTYTIKIVLNDGGPVDSVIFSHTVQACNFISVSANVDVNANCTYDTADEWVYGTSIVEVDSASVPIDTLSMFSGLWYKATAPAGTVYALRLLTPDPGLTLSCSSTGIIYDTIPATPFDIIPNKHFLFDCVSTSSAFDLSITASSFARRNTQSATISVSNTSCTGTAALVRFDYSPKYSFNSVDPAYSYTVSGTSVTFDIGSVSAHSRRFMNVRLDSAATLVLGDTANSTFTVTPISGDTFPANNVVSRCDTVKASFDPNHKSVTPTGNITAGASLEYMLDFENTGNDTAYNIHIMDTLSDNLDVNSLRGGISSHRVSLYQYNVAGYNILKFDFPNIMLPDSSHHDMCRGMVTFSVNAKSGLSPGTTIANRVGIYFDVNEVVMTNTVFSKIPMTTDVKSTSLSKVELYPNPVKDMLTIATSGSVYRTLAIYNIMGQSVAKQDVSSFATSIDVSALTPGIYYVSLKGEGGTKTIKFEKL